MQVELDALNLVDVVTCLGMKSHLEIKQSFNRPNLRYEVKPKGKNIYQDIYSLVSSHYPGASGIVYCGSRRACEDTAEKLKVGLFDIVDK